MLIIAKYIQCFCFLNYNIVAGYNISQVIRNAKEIVYHLKEKIINNLNVIITSYVMTNILNNNK